MKIDYALMSCDENPLYIDFIPVITKAWNRINIKPVFIIISDTKEETIDTEESLVIYFKNVEGISKQFQALNARIWAWKLIEGNAILSDLDMMPLSSNYFNGIASRYNEEQIVSYCNDAIEKFGQIAACYILANSKVMDFLIKESTWEEFINNRGVETGQGWGGDQLYLGEILNDHYNTVRLRRGFNSSGQAFFRLDRDSWHYNESDVTNGILFDAHLLRPYKKHKMAIDGLFSLL